MKDYRGIMETGMFYHIFNHSTGQENLFIENKNYTFFLTNLKNIFPDLLMFLPIA
jgi:hypothetical protein